MDVVLELVDLATEVKVSNMVVAESHSETGPAGKEPRAAVPVLLDEAGQEQVAGYVHQKCCHPFWNQKWVVKLYLQRTGGLTWKTLSAQAEVWPILFESQQVLACL